MIKDSAFNQATDQAAICSAILSSTSVQQDEIDRAIAEFRSRNPNWKPHTGKEIRDSKLNQGKEINGYEYSILWVEHISLILGANADAFTETELAKSIDLLSLDGEQGRIATDLAYHAGLAFKLERSFLSARLNIVQAHCSLLHIISCFDVARTRLAGGDKPGDVLQQVMPVAVDLVEIIQHAARTWTATVLAAMFAGYPEIGFTPTKDKNVLEQLLAKLYWSAGEYFTLAKTPKEDAGRFLSMFACRPLKPRTTKLIPIHLYPKDKHIRAELARLKALRIEDINPEEISIQLRQAAMMDQLAGLFQEIPK